MAENTPSGVTEEAVETGASAPVETAPASTPAPQEAAPVEKDSPAPWSPDALPETDRERAKAWAAEEAKKFHLTEVGKNGGWMRDMPDEVRQKLKRDPLYVTRLEAQLEESRKVTGGAGAPKQEVQGPDEIDQVTSELQKEFNLDDANTQLSRRIVEKTLKMAEKKLAEPLIKGTREAITSEGLKEKFDFISASPEWQDETEKGQDFRERFLGRMQVNRQSGKPQDPVKVYEDLKARMFPTPTATPSQPKAKPSMGDAPSGGLKPPAPQSADAVAEWDKKLREKGVDPRFW